MNKTTCFVPEEILTRKTSDGIEKGLRYSTFVVSCFGCVGNILSLLVLTRHRLRKSVESQEQVVYWGLLSITLSDLFFCVTIVPSVTVDQLKVVYTSNYDFNLIYNVYGVGVLTTFSLLSTWFVVVTAGLKYMGICHPLRARYLIHRSGAIVLFTLVFFFCIIVNLPAFWTSKIVTEPTDDSEVYIIDFGSFSHESRLGMAFMIIRFIFGVAVPFVLLIFFNSQLVVALKRSERFGKTTRPVMSQTPSRTPPPSGKTTCLDRNISTTPKALQKNCTKIQNVFNIKMFKSTVNKSDSSDNEKLCVPSSSTTQTIQLSPISEHVRETKIENRTHHLQEQINLKPSNQQKHVGRSVVENVRLSKVNNNIGNSRPRSNRLTVILILMTFMFILLILPSEVEDFIPKVLFKKSQTETQSNQRNVFDSLISSTEDPFNEMIKFLQGVSSNRSNFVGDLEEDENDGKLWESRQVTNLLHVVMFSCNFLFYTFFSVHFRQTLAAMVRNSCCFSKAYGETQLSTKNIELKN